MSNNLRYIVEKKKIDADDNISQLLEFSFDESFIDQMLATFTQATGGGYTAVTFQGITTATLMRIQSDKSINIKINGGSEIFVVNTDLIWTGSFTALSIENASGSSSLITVELYE